MSLPEQYGRLVSYSLRCPDVPLETFLYQARGQSRFYMENSRDDIAFAGTGTALEIMAWGEDRYTKIRDRARALFSDAVVIDEEEPLAAPRLFGGFAFRQDFVPDNTWADFTPAHFVLPHYQIVRIHDVTWLTINAHIPPDENPQDMAPALHAALVEKIRDLQHLKAPAIPADDTWHTLSYPMPIETWQGIITDATQRMAAGELNKVVLSRVAEVRFGKRVNVDRALAYLAQHYAETYRFLFEPRPYHAFYGATPELLADVQGQTVRTMGLAGSIGRGKSPAEDANLAQALLDSRKDRHEHQIVVDAMRERLEPVTQSLNVSPTEVMTLSNIQHLYTPIVGDLAQADGVLPVVEALHPTPALGGSPREIAMQLIGAYEPVPRGWYAAPVGWLDRHLNGQFVVAIRSAVAQERRVWLYAGAGIVQDSDPQKEWDETALKFKPMLNALGLFE